MAALCRVATGIASGRVPAVSNVRVPIRSSARSIRESLPIKIGKAVSCCTRVTVQTFQAVADANDNPTYKAEMARIIEGLRKAGMPEGEVKTN